MQMHFTVMRNLTRTRLSGQPKNIYLENVSANGKYGMKAKNIDNLQLVNVTINGEQL